MKSTTTAKKAAAKKKTAAKKPATLKVAKRQDIKKPVTGAFDTSAFVIMTPIEELEKVLVDRHAELEDLLEYRVPDHEQKKRIKDLLYWLGVWEMGLPEAKRRKMTSVPMSARERAALGFVRKSTK